MTDAPRKEIELYQHEERGFALLLSQTGKGRDAQWIPKSLIDEPTTSRLLKVDGIAVERGVFRVEQWKLRELGWEDEPDERQGSLL